MVYWEKYVPYRSLVFKPKAHDLTSRKKELYTDAIAAFDIETSRFKDIEQSAMYIWQFCIDFPSGEDVVILGRTWEEFQHCMFAIKQRLNGLKLLCFDQNASYEFQYLSSIYPFADDEVFILESRSILYFWMYGAIQFRCSYKLFNMSLAEATKKYAPDYHKREGKSFGYDEVRYSDTPLTHKQLLYCVYDVVGLCKAVRSIMDLFGDTVYSIPYTSTGYVRREIKAAMQPYYHKMRDMYPSYECYKLLRAAFRGGNTHANRYYANEILHNVKSVDISSSYPTQECIQQYPMTELKHRPQHNEKDLRSWLERGAACLIHLRLFNVELRNRYEPIPYLAIAKCVYYPDKLKADNGRILSCKECEIVITDIDFKIIETQYKFAFECVNLYTAWYDMLPVEIRDINRKYYKEKTKLKGVKGQELYYTKSKNLLNAIYGDTVQNILKIPILYTDGEYKKDERKTELEIYGSKGKRPYKAYQWGVWVTSWARLQLQQGLNLVGPDNVVYCDTDSVKFLGDADFTEYNKNRKRLAIDNDCVAVDKKGIVHYMGVYEPDETYADFITLGAKKYAFDTMESGPHITVAGVPKNSGAVELLYKGGLEAFQPGFTWTDTGKLESVYNDNALGKQKIDGHIVNFTKNIVLRPTTYKLDITEEYSDVLDVSSKQLDYIHEYWRRCQLKF